MHRHYIKTKKGLQNHNWFVDYENHSYYNAKDKEVNLPPVSKLEWFIIVSLTTIVVVSLSAVVFELIAKVA